MEYWCRFKSCINAFLFKKAACHSKPFSDVICRFNLHNQHVHKVMVIACLMQVGLDSTSIYAKTLAQILRCSLCTVTGSCLPQCRLDQLTLQSRGGGLVITALTSSPAAPNTTCKWFANNRWTDDSQPTKHLTSGRVCIRVLGQFQGQLIILQMKIDLDLLNCCTVTWHQPGH